MDALSVTAVQCHACIPLVVVVKYVAQSALPLEQFKFLTPEIPRVVAAGCFASQQHKHAAPCLGQAAWLWACSAGWFASQQHKRAAAYNVSRACRVGCVACQISICRL